MANMNMNMHMHMQMPADEMDDKMSMKRESYFNPCPPSHSHSISYAPPPQIYVKPIEPMVHVQKPMITYVKQAPQPVIVKPIAQPKVVYPVYQKPMISYAPIYQKPVYHQPIYQKPVYPEPMYQKLMYQPPKVILKKVEAPQITQVVHKPQISYPVHQPKVVQVEAPQVNYVKLPQPMVHAPIYQSQIKPWCA
ncbi:proline-rich protein 2-like [Ceratina calcarata]|uniref:Proline-rich protein 2-like n=1 Tax=Ceratina calcarata TaxID=156304 RepID=A0AAJ7S2H3_9HYME|nr:proline-rich protein 2-like [Ceratina calcarata]